MPASDADNDPVTTRELAASPPPSSGGSDTAAMPDAAHAAPNRRRTLWAMIIAVGLGVAIALGAVVISAAGGTSIEVVVPAGTADRMAAGQQVELLPALLRVDVGDELVIVNDDDEVHVVGPYSVAPGQTLRQQFTATGRIEGVCTLHPDGEIAIVVS